MIVFDLECQGVAHRFEGWFASSAEFVRQRDTGLIACPVCGSVAIGKAVTAPAIARKDNQLPAARPADAPPTGGVPAGEMVRVMRALAAMQADALKSSRWVGDRFAEDARAMHYGERDAETIHGKASASDAQALREEGIGIAPLPFPVIPAKEAN